MAAVAITIVLFIVFRGLFVVEPRLERVTVVSLMLLYVFLRYPTGGKKRHEKSRWLLSMDVLLILIVVITSLYTLWQTITDATSLLSIGSVRTDYIVGATVIVLSLEALRRSFGFLLVGLILVFLFYSFFADIFPGVLQGVKATGAYLLESLYIQEEGIYGIGTDILLNQVFPFLLFGSLLISTRVGSFFTSLALALVGRYSGGPAKVAVVGSAFVGTVSGSAIANVVTTGSVTIPLMKSLGFTPRFAGAVEAAASSGGYIMPPVMGVAAFVIAGLLGVPYILIAAYSAIPALLYFLGIFLQVHFRSRKDGLIGIPSNQLPSARRVLAQGWHLLVPFVVIVSGLLMGYSVTRVAIWGVISIILASFVRRETRQSAQQLLVSFEQSTDSSIGVSMVIACMGFIYGLVMISGLGMRLSLLVQALTMGNLLLALIVAAIINLILGMAGSPLLVYIICYVFVIPAMVDTGVSPIAASLFILFLAAAANITPPVCVAAFTAASIAGGPPMLTGWEACKLGFSAYLVSFLLVFHPGLILLGDSIFSQVIDILSATASIICISAAFEGWLMKRMTMLERILLFAAGVSLFVSSPITLAIGGGLLLTVALEQKFYPRLRYEVG